MSTSDVPLSAPPALGWASAACSAALAAATSSLRACSLWRADRRLACASAMGCRAAMEPCDSAAMAAVAEKSEAATAAATFTLHQSVEMTPLLRTNS